MTDQDYTREAERQLAAFMEAQRQSRVTSDILTTAFRDGEIAGAVSGTAVDSNHEEAKESARQHAQARNSGARVRHYNEDNESAREGLRSALDWIARKRKSAIRK